MVARNSWAPTDASKKVHRLGGYAALELDGSNKACGSFSSGTGSSHLASHEERSSAQVDLSVLLVLGSSDRNEAPPSERFKERQLGKKLS